MNRFFFQIPVFTVTLLLSAFMLFGVQPMVGKMILPLLGGTPQIWNTAMLFFQAFLLAGYGYAHITSRFLSVRSQAILHIALLTGCLLLLPIALPETMSAPDGGSPVLWQLGLMTAMAGGPFFVLAGCAPMLQRWFAAGGHPAAANPYFLYAASNLGSMAALISYPLLIEPFLAVRTQTIAWAFGFALLIAAVIASALVTGKTTGERVDTAAPRSLLSWPTRIQWIVLAFLPSSLMLGVTTYITTDLAAVPLLWVVPLALYVGTFIVAFARRPLWGENVTTAGFTIMAAATAVFLCHNFLPSSPFPVLLHFTLFFFAALLCHTRLAALKPPADRLTEFYLLISFGGVLGGIFNTLAAPFLFPVPLEYPVVLFLVALVRFHGRPGAALTPRNAEASLLRYFLPLALIVLAAAAGAAYSFNPTIPAWAALCAGALLLATSLDRVAFAAALFIMLACNPGFPWQTLQNLKALDRNFFGVTRVSDSASGKVRLMAHGTTVHGAQVLEGPQRFVPITYYYPEGPAGTAFGLLDDRPVPQRVAAIGLGAGGIACYTRTGRGFDFYEIDPAMQRIAQDKNLFTYLSGCRSPYRIIMGDGRLKIAEAADGSYDLIFLDAFSSDNIPVHLLTSEAFGLYKRKLKPGGFIAVNISNRYLDLSPVLDAAARANGMRALFRYYPGITAPGMADVVAYPSIYGILVGDPAQAALLQKARWAGYVGPAIPLWTDDYASPLRVLRMGKVTVPKNDQDLNESPPQ